MATSTIPAAKAALLTILQAALPDVQVTWGFPQGEPRNEWLMLAGAAGDQHAATMGQRRREETYTIDVVISVLRQGVNQQLASERAFAIAAELENAIRTNVGLSGAVRTAELVTPLELKERHSATTREAQLTLGIYCTARI